MLICKPTSLFEVLKISGLLRSHRLFLGSFFFWSSKIGPIGEHYIFFKVLTQSKSKTPITRSVHVKFNCITVLLDRTQHGFYIIQNVH